MDDREENLDFSAAAELPETNGETLPSSETPDLEAGADFSLDDFLNTESENAAMPEAASEELSAESLADGYEEQAAAGEDTAAGTVAGSGWLAEEAFSEESEKAVEETAAGSGWLSPFEENAETEESTATEENVSGGGWLAEGETAAEENVSSGDWSAEEETAVEENAASGGWSAEDEITAGLGADESEASVLEEAVSAGQEKAGDFVLPDEETAVNAENSLSNQAEETDFPTEENTLGGEGAFENTLGEESASENTLGEESAFEDTLGGESAPFETEAAVVPSAAAEENEFPSEEPVEAIPAFAAEPAGNEEMPAVYGNEANFVKWYSGSVHDEMFEVSKSNLPETINGSTGSGIIHINAGYDSYGWLVEFDNGLAMSLEDVRKYQIKNGALPSSGGVVRYGQNRCAFTDIERILIYRSVRYFSYSA